MDKREQIMNLIMSHYDDWNGLDEEAPEEIIDEIIEIANKEE